VPISLKQMRYAVALARTGHFGRAAEACAVSQPALSQQILALESLCGTALFDRLKSGVRLTPFGREFVDLAQAAIRQAEAVNAFALGHAGKPDRPVRFGLIPTVAPYLLPEIFPALTAALPEVAFAVSESRTETLLAGLDDGSLDIALIATRPPPGGPRRVVVPLFDDPAVVASWEKWVDMDTLKEQVATARGGTWTEWTSVWSAYFRPLLAKAMVGEATVDETMKAGAARWNDFREKMAKK